MILGILIGIGVTLAFVALLYWFVKNYGGPNF